jgi:hypothetical protein
LGETPASSRIIASVCRLSDRAPCVALRNERSYELGHVAGGDLVEEAATEQQEDAVHLEAVAGLRVLGDLAARSTPPLSRCAQRPIGTLSNEPKLRHT